MKISEIIIIAIGVSMDALAVAICKGLSIKNLSKGTDKFWKNAIIIGAYFGIFQALMPAIGYILGIKFQHLVESVDHWFAFILLGVIGTNMIHEALGGEKENINDKINFRTMIVLAIATSIDALSIGITFAFLKVNILLAISIIGSITFLLSILGVKIGYNFGAKYENISGLIGGIILILIGIKILLNHLGVI